MKWMRRAAWAPSVVENRGKFYFFFAANDIQNDQQTGGIGVAVSDHPEGPFVDYLGKPLIDKFHNGAQPIDPFVFKDTREGDYKPATWYIIYGGWRHCNIARLSDDFKTILPLADGTTFKEITPKGYVEGPYMMLRNGKYYLMCGPRGGWTGPNYVLSPTPSPIPPSVPSSASARSLSKTPPSPPARATTASSSFPARTSTSSSTTAAPSAKPTATTASSAWTRWSSRRTA